MLGLFSAEGSTAASTAPRHVFSPSLQPQHLVSAAKETLFGHGSTGVASRSNWSDLWASKDHFVFPYHNLKQDASSTLIGANRSSFSSSQILTAIAFCTLAFLLVVSTWQASDVQKEASLLHRPIAWLGTAFSKLSTRNDKASSAFLPTPPVVHIPREIQLSEKGHEAYVRALDEHGNDVVIIPRHGRKEYVVDYQHVRDVLTDASSYSFEKAVTNMLHMEFMLWFKNGTFVQELDKLVQDGVTPRLRAVVEKVAPVFANEAAALRETGSTTEITDVYTWVHRAIAQAMVILILGESYLTTEMTEHFMAIVVAIANLAGIYENNEGWRYFSWLWSLKTTLKAIFGTVVPRFFCGVLPIMWRNRQAHLEHGVDVEQNEYAPFFDLLAAKHRNRNTGKMSFINFVWCAIVCLGIIFASIHQTAVVAVWCVFGLAQRQDEYIDALRQEWTDAIEVDAEGQPSLTVESLKQLSLLDSFIRETMRTKGDTFAPVRYTTRDVRVGKYIIPKNSLVAPYVKRAHEHPANYGPDGTKFDGFQWHHKGKPAVQGNHDFISFGLGRWACPGRHLAIAEIKMVLVTLFANYDVQLKPNTFRIVDPMNATSVAPEGTLCVTPRA